MPELVKRCRQWSYHRQFLGKQGANLTSVLNQVIGVYSAHPSGPLSLYSRVKSFDPKAFHALDLKRHALRIPAMRLSVHLVPRHTASRIFAATVPPATDPIWAKRYSQKGRAMPPGKYETWKKEILELAFEPAPAKTFKDQTLIPADILKAVLNRMAYEGFLVRVGSKSLRSNNISYASASEWANDFLETVPIDKSRSWLAGRYLHAFGPARVEDFQWWAGITAGVARKAVTSQKTVYLGEGYVLLASDQDEFESFKAPRKDRVDLLPQWDCYTMGYAPDGRARIVDPDFQDRIYGAIGATGGNAFGTVLVNGEANGSWSFRFKGTEMAVTLGMFEKPNAKLKTDLSDRFDELAKLLDAKSVSFRKS